MSSKKNKKINAVANTRKNRRQTWHRKVGEDFVLGIPEPEEITKISHDIQRRLALAPIRTVPSELEEVKPTDPKLTANNLDLENFSMKINLDESFSVEFLGSADLLFALLDRYSGIGKDRLALRRYQIRNNISPVAIHKMALLLNLISNIR